MEMMRKRNGRVGCVELSMLSTYRESGGDAVWTVTFFITAFSSSHQHCKIEAAKWNENICYYSKHPEVFFLIHPEGLRYLSMGAGQQRVLFPTANCCFGGLGSWHRYPTKATRTFTCCLFYWTHHQRAKQRQQNGKGEHNSMAQEPDSS